MQICDAHCHFFSRGLFETLARELPGMAAVDPAAALASRLGWEVPGTAAELADRWVAELDRHHVRRAVLIASVPGDEGSVAEAVARHPARVVGAFMHDPTAPDAAARLDRALDRGSLRIVCLYPAMHRFRLDGDRTRRVFEAAARRPGTAVFVHCGVLSVGVRTKLGLPARFDIRLGQPLDLLDVADRHPQVPILIPHFGAGFLREALMAAGIRPNIHFDTSSSNAWIRYCPGLDLAGVFRQAIEVAGVDRVLFGTDSSFFPRGWQRKIHEEQVDALREVGVSPDGIHRILFENFDRLFPRAGA
jgi:predicted TIM-barrel fold metal-dependent hydrolase